MGNFAVQNKSKSCVLKVELPEGRFRGILWMQQQPRRRMAEVLRICVCSWTNQNCLPRITIKTFLSEPLSESFGICIFINTYSLWRIVLTQWLSCTRHLPEYGMISQWNSKSNLLSTKLNRKTSFWLCKMLEYVLTSQGFLKAVSAVCWAYIRAFQTLVPLLGCFSFLYFLFCSDIVFFLHC